MYETINPTTNQKIKSFSTLTKKEIGDKLELSNRVYRNTLLSTTIDERAEWVKKIAKELNTNTQTYAEIATLEMGKPIKQSIAEVEKCAWLCEYFADHAAIFLQNKVVVTNYQKSYIRFDPLGTVLGIMPWNFPFWQAFRFAVPALLAGNAVLLKPASNVPQCGLAMEKMFRDACGISGVFQTLFVETEDIEHIIQNPVLKGLALTGSERAGASVAELAGKHIKKCVLELGGSDPFIVLDDADLEKAAEVGVQARMQNNGQSCIAAKRFMIHSKVADRFIQLLKDNIGKLKIGDANDLHTDLSALARADLMEGLAKQVEQSIELGAKVLLDGGSMNRTGNYFHPVILTNLKPGMPAHDEELFGPVISLFIVKTDQEAIELANNTVYGLGAAIWTQNIERAERMAQQIESGMVFINDFVKSDPRMPFGGVKRSGYGRELSEDGIKEFVNIKTVVVH